MTANEQPKFSLGQILATPGALDTLQESGQNIQFFLARHVKGDWGEVCQEDGQLNDQALIDGSRLLSAYRLADGTKIWLITEAVGENGRRESSTFLLPSEY